MILFSTKGGGERLVLMIANVPLEADIASGFFSPGSYNLREQGFKWAMIPLMPWFFLHEFTWMPRKMAFIFKNGLRHFGLKWAFSMNVEETQRYLRYCYPQWWLPLLCVILRGKKSSTTATPYRDISLIKGNNMSKKSQKSYSILTVWWLPYSGRPISEISVKSRYLLTNSKNTQKSIKTFTDRDAEILYPPVDTDFFCPADTSARKTIFSPLRRLSSIKRVDRIVAAFQEMPEERLIITYGKNDPEKQNIKMVEGYTNIRNAENHPLISNSESLSEEQKLLFISLLMKISAWAPWSLWPVEHPW
jgi:glycosyltransferase involved in cell wall biosynthesis